MTEFERALAYGVWNPARKANAGRRPSRRLGAAVLVAGWIGLVLKLACAL